MSQVRTVEALDTPDAYGIHKSSEGNVSNVFEDSNFKVYKSERLGEVGSRLKTL